MKLDEHQNVLFIGKNGAGKSTILDALTFVLFGRPFRDINKPKLINSINEKECIVEIEFTNNSRSYKIIRGMKPNIFEIYCNGTLLNQAANMKDYQEELEKNILRMNYKVFTQIVILGSAEYIPFMRLSKADRRGIIEELLDIGIFSTMNILVKKESQINKEKYEKNKLEFLGKEEKKTFIEKTLESLHKNTANNIAHIESQISHVREDLAQLDKDVDIKYKEADSLSIDEDKLKKMKNKHHQLLVLHSKIETNHRKSHKHLTFYGFNDYCPTCEQIIDEDFKKDIINKNEIKIRDYETGMEKLKKEIGACVDNIDELNNNLKQKERIKSEIALLGAKRYSLYSHMEELIDKLKNMKSSDTGRLIEENEKELAIVNADIKRLNEEREEILNERQYIETSIGLLKDEGIKAKIIKKYLPVLNKSINYYLSQMGFFVNFEINEQFEETIKSRYRDIFSYHNFSEGEKFRINLAILFAWRNLAKVKNSVNTNLLILDEIFDSSLDVSGTDEFIKIMFSMKENTNTFIISHKQDQLIDKFKKVIRFEKIKDFTRMVE